MQLTSHPIIVWLSKYSVSQPLEIDVTLAKRISDSDERLRLDNHLRAHWPEVSCSIQKNRLWAPPLPWHEYHLRILLVSQHFSRWFVKFEYKGKDLGHFLNQPPFKHFSRRELKETLQLSFRNCAGITRG